MSNISTFGTFTMARLGIYASHKALDIVGNNISNINTEGYTRQSIDQFSMNMGGADRYHSMMDTRVGSGAFVAGVTQERDQYMDIRYRAEQSSVGAMEARVDSLNQIASVLDEVGKGEDGEGVLEARFNEMIQMMQELNTKGAGKDQFDTLFRSSATTVVNTLHNYATELDNLTQNQIDGMQRDLDDVNSILERIRELNTNIRKTQIYGGNSLEQQDERNLLLDDLSKYMKISITTEKEYLGEKLYVDKLVVKTTDDPQRTLVDGIYATTVSIRGQVYSEDTTDSDGTTHKAGEPVLDEKGEQLRDPDYNLDMGPLKDVNGRSLQLNEDKVGPVAVTRTVTVNSADLADAANPATVFESEWEASAIATQLTADDVDGYTYNVQETEEDSGRWVIQRLPVGGGNSLGEMAVDASVSYVRSAAGEDVTGTEFGSKEEAEEALKQLAAAAAPEYDEDGNKLNTEYRLVEKQTVTEAENEDDEDVVTTTYTLEEFKIFNGEVQLRDTELYGALASRRDVLTKQGVFSTAEELAADPDADTKRGLPFYRKALDVLANTFANALNGANQLSDPDKIYYRYNTDGSIRTDEYGRYQLTAAGKEIYGDSQYVGGALFSNSGSSNDPTGITAANISISASWANGSLRVMTDPESEELSTANTTLNRFLGILTQAQVFRPQIDGEAYDGAVSSDIFFTGSFQDLLTTHLAGGLADDINLANTMLRNYETMSDELYVDRDAVMGVDLNDEAMNMMMYQKSYSAACRLMTVYDEMLDKLINGTAV